MVQQCTKLAINIRSYSHGSSRLIRLYEAGQPALAGRTGKAEASQPGTGTGAGSTRVHINTIKEYYDK